MGPIVTQQALERIEGYIDARRRRKARSWWSMAAATRCKGHEGGFFTGGTLFDHVTPRDAHLQGRDLRPGAGLRARARLRRGACSWSTSTSSATAWPASPATATSRASSRAACRSAWSASTCRSRCRWPGTASAAGRSSLFGDMHAYGEEGVRFYTKQKTRDAALAREHRQGRRVRDADVAVTPGAPAAGCVVC